jgi:Predicted transcriptional regulators
MKRGEMTTTDFATDTMTPMKSTAGFVKRARAKLQMTQGEFAERLGLERRTIIRYEKGEPLPPTVYFAIKHLVSRHKLNKQRAKDRATAKED